MLTISAILQANFDAAISTIPDGADVVFVFGEIDCREGPLISFIRSIIYSLFIILFVL